MKRLIGSIGIVTIVTIVCAATGMAQFPEDALRLSAPGLGVSARSLSMGMAYTGVANDFSAIFWNPAGLAQMQMNEVSLGFSHNSFGNTSTFQGNQQSFTNSSTSLNNFGIVYPFPTTRGSFVIALGYGKQNDFTTGLSFQGFNPSSSIVQVWAPNDRPYPPDVTRAENLELARIDTNTGRFISPITGNVLQLGKVLEGGGQNYWSFAGAIEAARNLYLGATLNFISGSYSYNSTYAERDRDNHYSSYPFDFDELSVRDIVESDLSGFTMKLGLLYRFPSGARLGLAVKTPSWISVNERFTSDATSYFDNGDSFSDPANPDSGSRNEYDVTTPFVFSGGLSVPLGVVMLAADLEYTDWTQMEFRNAPSQLLSYNTTIKEIFRPTLNIRLGGELRVPATDIRVRGGFAYLPSPYDGDPTSYAQKYATGGLGLVLENAFAIDLGYAYGFWDSYRQIYSGARTQKESIGRHSLMATVSYRF
jgi:long-subunit fatty acid transport protein